MRISKFTATSLVVLLLGAAIWISISQPQAQEAGQADHDPATEHMTSHEKRQPLRLTRQREIGLEEVFSIHHESRGDFDLSIYFDKQSKPNFQQKLQTEYKGRVIRTLIATQPKLRYFFKFETESLQARVNSDPSPLLVQKLLDGLAKGVVAESTADGLIQKLIFDKRIPIESQDFLLTLIKKFQINLPELLSSRTWTSKESDLAGRFTARYELKQPAAGALKTKPLLIRKSKDQFHELNFHLSGDLNRDQIHADSEGGFDLIWSPEKQHLTQIQGSETVHYVNQNNQHLGSNTESIAIDFQTSQVLANSQVESLLQLIDERGAEQWTYTEARDAAQAQQLRRIHEQRWQNSQLSDLLSLLRELPSLEPEKRHDQAQDLFLKLRSFVYLFPEDVHHLKNYLKSADPLSPGFETALAALINISNEASQQLVVELIEESLEDPTRLERTLPMAGFTKAPGLELEQSLRYVAENHQHPDMQMTAKLALGVLGSRLLEAAVDRSQSSQKQQFQQRYRDLELQLRQQLESAQDNASRIKILQVLGNTASGIANDLIRTYLRADDPELVVASVMALRFQSFDSVSELLDLVSGSEQEEILEAMATSLSFMTSSPAKFRYVARHLEQVTHPEAQLQLLDTLFRERHFDPEYVQKLLQQISQDSKNQNLQNYALDLLQQVQMGS